jgi:glycosyltransferase involved in cell wall biosynthesis
MLSAKEVGMRILEVIYEYPPLGGGGGVIASQVIEELAKKHMIDVVTTHFKGLPRSEPIHGANVLRVPVLGRRDLATATLPSLLSYAPACLVSSGRQCLQTKYDIIHAHFAVPSGPVAVLLAKTFRVPLLLSIYGGDIYDPSKKLSPHRNPVLRTAVQWVLNQADCVVAESTDIKSRAKEHYSCACEIKVIPCGIQPPLFQDATREAYGIDQDEFVIACVGRLVKRKGIQYLLRAVAKLDSRRIKVLLMGDGPEKEFLASLADELGIINQVVFLGRVTEEQKYQYLSISDIFVLPSLHEGFGIVILEAMYCGLPIITTNAGGQTDFVVDGRNGFLVAPEDEEALHNKIRLLLENRTLRETMRNANTTDVKSFTVENTASRYEHHMQLMIQARGEGLT